MKNPSIAIFLPNFASGGAERVQLNLAPEFRNAGWDVTFVVQKLEGPLQHQLQDIKVVSLNAKSTFGALSPLRYYLKKEKPDILLSNLGHNNIVAVWAARLALVKTKVVVCQHNTLSVECTVSKNWRFRILPFLSTMFLPLADGIICVSKGVANDLSKLTGIARERIRAIYNPIVLPDFAERMLEPVNHPWLLEKTMPVIVSAGRLSEQKDFRTLIAAFAKTRAQKPCRLLVLGEGPLLTELKEYARSLGVSADVDFAGFQPNILPFMHAADLLVMSSRYEGFGNVLVEALACGTPVISTDCPYGPAEILEQGRFGRLVPIADPDAMADAIIASLNSAHDLDMLKARGNEFTVRRAANNYMALFNEILSHAGTNSNP